MIRSGLWLLESDGGETATASVCQGIGEGVESEEQAAPPENFQEALEGQLLLHSVLT